MRRSAVLFVLAVLLAGCSSDAGIGQKASGVLMPQVVAVREAVKAGDKPAAVTNLAALKAEVGRLNQDGTLDGDNLSRVNGLIAGVEKFVLALPDPVQPAPPVAPLEFPQEAVEGSQSGDGQRGKPGERGKDGGRGKDGDD